MPRSLLSYTIGYWWENERKRPLGKPRRRLLDNIKINLREIGCGGMG
jgi:hypothetical protein